MSTDQVLFGVGLILLLAVGSQVLASRLRIPALIILPVGFVVGALTTDVNPQRLLGTAFQPLVSLAVGVILYDAGLALDLAKLRGNTRRVTTRLITVGVVLTWLVAAALAGLLFGLSVQAALMEVRARSLTGWFPGSAGGLRAGRCPRHLAGCLVAS